MNDAEKVAVITGAAQGLGAAFAAKFAARGLHVVLADKNLEGVEKQEQDLTERYGITALAVHVDVADSDALGRLAARTLSEFGRVDVLVNNAGIAEQADTLSVTDATLDEVVRVNLLGPIVACREFGAALIESKGVVVNISSIAAFAAVRPEHHVCYDATKAGVAALTRSLAVEWAEHGVRVNAVAPGYSATPILDGVGANDPETMQTWLSQVPQGRLMQPSEIAEVVSFLASDNATAITGQTVAADGGYLASK